MRIEQPLLIDRLMAGLLHHLSILKGESKIESISFIGLRRYQSPVGRDNRAVSRISTSSHKRSQGRKLTR